MKTHLCCILGPVKLNFVELPFVLFQVEAYMNSKLLVALPPDDNGLEALTPGHLLIGHPIELLSNMLSSYNYMISLASFATLSSPRSSNLEELVK